MLSMGEERSLDCLGTAEPEAKVGAGEGEEDGEGGRLRRRDGSPSTITLFSSSGLDPRAMFFQGRLKTGLSFLSDVLRFQTMDYTTRKERKKLVGGRSAPFPRLIHGLTSCIFLLLHGGAAKGLCIVL